MEKYILTEGLSKEEIESFVSESSSVDILDFENNEGYEKFKIYLKPQNCFLSQKLYAFILQQIENDSEIELVLIGNDFSANKIIIDWTSLLKRENNFNIKVVAELDQMCETVDAKEEVIIYTDGACSGNPGKGGWGAILMHGNSKKEISGYDENTTNNKMELTAVIKALSMLKKPCKVQLYSDSAYVCNAITLGWLENWKNNFWVGADKKEVKNIELWKELDFLLKKHSVVFNKVKGHSNDELNNRCDELATGEIAKHN